MKNLTGLNPRTAALIAGILTGAGCLRAEEAQVHQLLTAVSATTLSGYVDTSASWMFGTGEKETFTADYSLWKNVVTRGEL